MNIYELAIAASTQEEAARLLRNMSEETAQIRQQLEWLWANCKIVAWPGGDDYPIEHNPHALKDNRALIEALMPYRTNSTASEPR